MDIGRDLRHQSGVTGTLNAPTSNPAPVDPTSNNAAPKKRRGGAAPTGSRGVANLTPEQLAKKRANDREAQRAIRERTKGQIEKLEREIAELRGQQPFQELQNAIRQRELVEAENRDIKNRLVSVLGLIQPLTTQIGATHPIQLPQRNGTVPSNIVTAGLSTASQVQGSNAPLSATSSSYTSSTHTTDTTPSISHATPYGPHPSPFPAINQRTHASNLQSPRPEEKLDVGYLINARQDVQSGREPFAEGRTTAFSLPMHTLSPYQAGRNPFSGTTPVFALPPKHIPPTCPLDGLLLDFLADRRQAAEKGATTMQLIGPEYPSVTSILDSTRSLQAHPLSKVFTDMLTKFPDISELAEQVAVVYVMFLLARWQIFPTSQSYARLPTWMIPTPSQLTTPHPAWIDHLPFPRMRDTLVAVYPSIPFDEFFIPYTTTLSLNWPYEDRDILLTMPGSDEIGINPVFESHMRDLGNWTLGPAFAKAHPVLAETASIRSSPRAERRRTEGAYN